MYKNYFISFVSSLITLFLVMISVNYFIDSGNIFHYNTDFLVENICNGHNIFITSNNVNYRKLKCDIIEKYTNKVEAIIIGSSEIMWINNSLTTEKTVLNAGVNSAWFDSYIGILGALFYNNIHFKKIYFHVRPEFFYDELCYDDEIFGYRDWMLDYLNTNQFSDSSIEKSMSDTNINYTNLFSVPYFKENIYYFFKNFDKIRKYGRFGICSDGFNLPYIHCADLSLDQGNQLEDAKYVREDSLNMVNDLYPDNYLLLSKNKCKIFEDLIEFIQKKNIEICFIIPPIAPSLWENIKTTNKNDFEQLEKYVHGISLKYHVKCIGNFNPEFYNLKDSDFYDSRHIRRERLSILFN